MKARLMMLGSRFFAALVFGGILVGVEGAESTVEEDLSERLERLKSLSLDELLVTSVSKKSEKVFDAAAAVTVITNEEIRRSGVRNLPDVLRLVPGMEVARITGNQWAVSARGFNDRFSNKLLVLVDGRAVYNPAFSGVYWDTVSVLLEDIDRIEVVRGPGGTLWGANAVNGVVNIITKDSRDTKGAYIVGGYGTEQRGFGSLRYGADIGETGTLRGYFRSNNQDRLVLPSGQDAFDGQTLYQGGFRSDWELESGQLTFQGDVFVHDYEQQFLSPSFAPPAFFNLMMEEGSHQGGNALFRWTHEFTDGSELQFQSYWDRWEVDSELFSYELDTVDFDVQHRLDLPIERHEMVYGFGYRLLMDASGNTDPNLIYNPASVNRQIFSSFIQDEMGLIENELKLTLGTKLSHNDYTGFELQPNARLAWTPTETATLWTAVSRAVRTPSRTESDIILNLLTPNSGAIFPRGFGSSSFESENLLAYEAGFRTVVRERLTLDLSLFYNRYDDLLSSETGMPFFDAGAGVPVIPVSAGNRAEIDAYGLELAPEVELADWWRMRGGYSYIDYRNAKMALGTGYQNQFFARSSMDLGRDVDFDATIRHVGRLRGRGVGEYLDFDLRVAWRPRDFIECALVGRNLGSAQRIEFSQSQNIATIVSEVQRGVYGQVSMRF